MSTTPRIRPSSLPALAKCPSYVPDQSTGEEQKSDGTIRHDALFRVLGAESKEDETAILDTLGEPDRMGVDWAAEYVRTHANMDAHPLVREQKSTFVGPDFESVEGTPDVTCGPVVFDLKWREDVSDYSTQMAAYALMQVGRGHECVTVHILYALHRRVDVLEFTEDTAAELVFPIIEAAKAPASKPSACEYCGWCAKRLTCHAVAAEVEKAGDGTDVATLDTAEAMGSALKTARVVKEWCAAVESAAKEMAFKRGAVPTGFKPVTQRGRRQIDSVVDAFGVAGLPQDEFLKACSVGFGDLAEAFAKFNGLPKAAAERDIETRLGDALKRGNNVNMLKEI